MPHNSTDFIAAKIQNIHLTTKQFKIKLFLGVHGLKINFIRTSNTNIDTAETGTYISNSQPNIANGGGTLPTGVMPGGNYVLVHVSTFMNETGFGYQEYLSFNYQNGNMKKWRRVKTVDGWQSWVLEFENV